MIASVPEPAAPAHITQTEIWFRRVLVFFSIIAGLCVVGHFGIMLWAENGFTGPEAVVAAQSMMLADHGTLYYSLASYPYTVCAYMPILYSLEAGLHLLGLTTYMAGRLVSFCALLGILALIWRMALLYTRDRYCAWTAALLAASSGLLLYWGTVGQVDTLAAMFALAAFYQYSRYALRGERTLIWAAAFALLAFFTKQTMLACPAAIFVLLLFQRPKTALRFGAGLAATAAALVLAANTAMDGRFLRSTVIANMNAHSWEKVWQHLSFAMLSAGGLMLVAIAGASRALRGAGRALFVYLAFSCALFVVIASKVGSDLNYQIESTILLILCVPVALHALNFFAASFERSRTWVTLLQLPLAVFLVVNYGITLRDGIVRVVTERITRGEIERLRPQMADPGLVLSADYNAMMRLRGRLDVEMLIYNWLVEAKVIQPEQVTRDIAAGRFSTILMMEDVNRPETHPSIEISTLQPNQLEEIRRHYRLLEQNAIGVYVYKPIRANS
ncbi:MAG TPA: glycosyltransferase family 39 protein, partial [Bryobacteraceae bacterium]|nr:glycosyltransferase family 39 protein [Bryobacteraceae bacterium]